MTETKHTGVIDGILDRNVTIDGKVLFAGEKVKPHLAKFHQGDTVTYTLDRKMKGTIDTMFPSTVFGSQIASPSVATNGGKAATAPASAPTAAPAPKPAPSPAPAAKAAPAAPPVAAPPKGNGKLPQEMREERICRMSCLKSAVDLLKDQSYLMAHGPMVQRKIVLVMAQDFTRWVNTGESPGEFTEGSEP